MKRHVVVIGKTGQLARALIDRADSFNCQIEAYDREACDLSASVAEISAFADKLSQCDGIIIAAAYTAVDAAEDDKDEAFQVNGAAPDIFARLCRDRSIPLIHVSTDYVFQGDSKTPITVDAPTDPINVYGLSKLEGETAIMASGARAAILRTSWVYDGRGKNFLTTMLRLGETRHQLSVVADQIGRPTYAGHLADACLIALSALMDKPQLQGGIYHVSGTGPEISWADFATAIFAATKDTRGHVVTVTPIPTLDYPTPAKRPAYSVLDNTSFEQAFNTRLPEWKEGLAAALVEWRSQ